LAALSGQGQDSHAHLAYEGKVLGCIPFLSGVILAKVHAPMASCHLKETSGIHGKGGDEESRLGCPSGSLRRYRAETPHTYPLVVDGTQIEPFSDRHAGLAGNPAVPLIAHTALLVVATGMGYCAVHAPPDGIHETFLVAPDKKEIVAALLQYRPAGIPLAVQGISRDDGVPDVCLPQEFLHGGDFIALVTDGLLAQGYAVFGREGTEDSNGSTVTLAGTVISLPSKANTSFLADGLDLRRNTISTHLRYSPSKSVGFSREKKREMVSWEGIEDRGPRYSSIRFFLQRPYFGNLVPAGVAAEDGAKGNEDDSLCIMYPATLHTGIVACYLTGDDD